MPEFWEKEINLSSTEVKEIGDAYNKSIWQGHLKVFELTGNPWFGIKGTHYLMAPVSLPNYNAAVTGSDKLSSVSL